MKNILINCFAVASRLCRHNLGRALLIMTVALAVSVVVIAQPRAEIDAHTADVGNVYRGETVAEDFVIKNTGKRALMIRRTDLSCGTTTSAQAGTLIPAGTALTVKVVAQTTGLRDGSGYRTVTLHTNDIAGRPIDLSIGMTVISEFDLSQTHLRLTSHTKASELVVRRTGASEATIIGATASDPRVRVTLDRIADTRDAVHLRVEWMGQPMRAWDLGNIVVDTSSTAAPRIVIPVRGDLLTNTTGPDPKLDTAQSRH
jgi:hypothetical protein